MPGTTAKYANPQRSNHRVPARLFVCHAHIVLIRQVEHSLSNPIEFDRLSLHRLTGHPFDFSKNEQRSSEPDYFGVAK